jgi:hypothetical protein
MYKKLMDIWEYIPLALLALFFVAEEEMHNKAMSLSCQFCIMILCTVLFFFILFKIGYNKYIALIIAITAWIILVYIKRKYII